MIFETPDAAAEAARLRAAGVAVSEARTEGGGYLDVTDPEVRLVIAGRS
jgi:hypothetical protein